MLITCRTLAGQKFTVEANGSDSVKTLKDAIAEAQGDAFPTEHQRLIYSGKVMSDEDTLEKYGVTESGFIVVMATKPKPAPAPAPATPAGSAAAPVGGDESKTPAAAATTAAPAAPTATSTSSSSAVRPAERENTLVHGEEYEQAVAGLVNMGFAREKAVAAMAASFNNPDRAAEYLLSGSIPASSGGGGEEDDDEGGSEGGSSAGGGGGSGGGFIEQLRQWPQFQMLRRVVAQDQSLLPTLLQQIGQSNPQLLQEIQANQEEFLRFLNEPPSDAETAAGGGGGVGQQPAGGQQPRQTLLRVTPEERAAIDRLKDLGFSEQMVIEAYFACDKNEDAAANFLLNECFEEES